MHQSIVTTRDRSPKEESALSYLIISAAAFGLAVLTLFSGFGLGMLLMPAFALFFPVEVAISATAVVHLANNVFKVGLLGKHANWRVVLAFGAPAVAAAVLGAWLLDQLGDLPPLTEYKLGERHFMVTSVKLVVAILMAIFAVMELIPRFERMSFHPRFVPVGGALSGFFGGLSGHQGAFRAAFLIRLGLSKESFIGTSSICAALVDTSRLLVYGMTVFSKHWAVLESEGGLGLVVAGTVAAVLGSLLGTWMIRKVTLGAIRVIVGLMLLLLAAALGTGLI